MEGAKRIVKELDGRSERFVDRMQRSTTSI